MGPLFFYHEMLSLKDSVEDVDRLNNFFWGNPAGMQSKFQKFPGLSGVDPLLHSQWNHFNPFTFDF